MPSRFPVFVHEEFLSEDSILQSTLNISLRVPVIFGAAIEKTDRKSRNYTIPHCGPMLIMSHVIKNKT